MTTVQCGTDPMWELLESEREPRSEAPDDACPTCGTIDSADPGARRALTEALRAVLLFHSGSPWTPEKSAEWDRLVGGFREASTKVLCDTVRAALTKAGG